jgi:hypothetical protein
MRATANLPLAKSPAVTHSAHEGDFCRCAGSERGVEARAGIERSRHRTAIRQPKASKDVSRITMLSEPQLTLCAVAEYLDAQELLRRAEVAELEVLSEY